MDGELGPEFVHDDPEEPGPKRCKHLQAAMLEQEAVHVKQVRGSAAQPSQHRASRHARKRAVAAAAAEAAELAAAKVAEEQAAAEEVQSSLASAAAAAAVWTAAAHVLEAQQKQRQQVLLVAEAKVALRRMQQVAAEAAVEAVRASLEVVVCHLELEESSSPTG